MLTLLFTSVIVLVTAFIIASIIKIKYGSDSKNKEHNKCCHEFDPNNVGPIHLNMNATYKSINSTDVAYPIAAEKLEKEQDAKNYIKRYFGADPSDEHVKVIFVSSATEAIATTFHWIKHYYPTVEVYGSCFDHSSIKDNCELYGLRYIDDKYELTKRAKAMVITQVNPQTGEIYEPDLDEINKYEFALFDVSQSIGKVDLDLSTIANDYAVFFSLHKIGGNKNCGILLLRDTNHKFIPLIAGKQQNYLRGGTYDQDSYLNIRKLIRKYECEYNYKRCKVTWNKFMEGLEGLNVYRPIYRHLYTTLLITYEDCVLDRIAELSKENIYVSAATSCLGSEDTNHIRISFINPSLTNEQISHICEILQKNK